MGSIVQLYTHRQHTGLLHHPVLRHWSNQGGWSGKMEDASKTSGPKLVVEVTMQPRLSARWPYLVAEVAQCLLQDGLLHSVAPL
eukprot:9475308-Pyramimonas_sp.AAC.2